MPNPKRRHSKQRTAKRRSHDFLVPMNSPDNCPNCGERKLSHRACPKCGEYKGRSGPRQGRSTPANAYVRPSERSSAAQYWRLQFAVLTACSTTAESSRTCQSRSSSMPWGRTRPPSRRSAVPCLRAAPCATPSTSRITLVGPQKIASLLPSTRLSACSPRTADRPPARRGRTPPHLASCHASEWITMNDKAAQAVRSKRDSSMRVGLKMRPRGPSPRASSPPATPGPPWPPPKWSSERSRGVDRPCPRHRRPHQSLASPSLLLDVGANVDCDPENLVQFAIMGSMYARNVLRRFEQPARSACCPSVKKTPRATPSPATPSLCCAHHHQHQLHRQRRGSRPLQRLASMSSSAMASSAT